MKILALEHELTGATLEKFQLHAKEEAQKAWDLHQAGILRELFFRADREEAVLVMECASVEEAREVTASLPFVQNKLIEFEFIPLKAYPGFERLFVKD